VSNADVTTIRKLGEQVHWRWVLPIIMSALTLGLALNGAFAHRLPDYPWRLSDAPGNVNPIEYIIAAAINGPGFLPPLRFWHLWFFYEDLVIDLTWLPSTLAFWFVAGVAIEMRLRAGNQVFVKRRWVRILLFSFSIVFGMLLSFGLIYSLYSHRELPFARLVESIKQDGWWARELIMYPELIWSLACVAYFGTKLRSTLRPCQPLTATTP
jgi:hypothetical protein